MKFVSAITIRKYYRSPFPLTDVKTNKKVKLCLDNIMELYLDIRDVKTNKKVVLCLENMMGLYLEISYYNTEVLFILLKVQ